MLTSNERPLQESVWLTSDRTHLKNKHYRSDLQRCHICKHRFPLDQIEGHGCSPRDIPPDDYKQGFDAVQLEQLKSKDLCPKKVTDYECWGKMFRILFPYWPRGNALPDPCE